MALWRASEDSEPEPHTRDHGIYFDKGLTESDSRPLDWTYCRGRASKIANIMIP